MSEAAPSPYCPLEEPGAKTAPPRTLFAWGTDGQRKPLSAYVAGQDVLAFDEPGGFDEYDGHHDVAVFMAGRGA